MNKTVFAAIAGMSLVTALPRILPILMLSGRRLPGLFERWLSLIAPAALSALLLPELLFDRASGTLLFSVSNTFLMGSIPAFLVAWKTKSLFGTVITGIAAVALLRAAGL